MPLTHYERFARMEDCTAYLIRVSALSHLRTKRPRHPVKHRIGPIQTLAGAKLNGSISGGKAIAHEFCDRFSNNSECVRELVRDYVLVVQSYPNGDTKST